jgi:hypothetical protein
MHASTEINEPARRNIFAGPTTSPPLTDSMFTPPGAGGGAERNGRRRAPRLSALRAQAAAFATVLGAACVCAALFGEHRDAPATLERIPAIAPSPERVAEPESTRTNAASGSAQWRVDPRASRRRTRGREASVDRSPRSTAASTAPAPDGPSTSAPPPAPRQLTPPASAPPVAPPSSPVRPRRRPLPVEPGAPPEFM